MNDISFLNRDTGVIASAYDIYQTFDRGQTWTKIAPITNGLSLVWTRVVYLSASVIYASGYYLNGQQGQNGIFFYYSYDGGQTWTSSNTGALCFTVARNGTIFSQENGTISSSHNNGVSFDSIGSIGSINLDSYSIDIDSCDPNRLYILNENYADSGDHFSKVFTSSDGGVTWSVAISQPTHFFSGGFAISQHCEFAPTWHDGIFRSTDQGSTWTNCAPPSPGGPLSDEDTRSICPINDNLIFDLDKWGAIWVTHTSGVDSLIESNFPPSGSLSIAPASLFQHDTMYVCHGSSRARSVALFPSGCTPPGITRTEIIGAGAASYQVDSVSYDSIEIGFSALTVGQQQALLVLHLDNGTSDTVSLTGVGAPSKPLALTTSDETTDTLGDSVAVPIKIIGLDSPSDVILILHYDASLNYLGSFSPTGTKLDLPNEQWPGRSMIKIVQADPGVIAGYASFDAFHDSTNNPKVIFDSCITLDSSEPCKYLPAQIAVSTIMSPSGCGSTILSRFLESGKIPMLSVWPNPANRDVEITSSANLGPVRITIYDMLGAVIGETSTVLTNSTPISIPLPYSDGIYNLRVQSSLDGAYDLRVVVRQ